MKWWLGLLAVGAVVALAIWLWRLFAKPEQFSHLRSHHLFNEAGHSVWCFEQGSWRLLEDKSAPGFALGPPPAAPGVCEGYCMKVASIRDPEAH